MDSDELIMEDLRPECYSMIEEYCNDSNDLTCDRFVMRPVKVKKVDNEGGVVDIPDSDISVDIPAESLTDLVDIMISKVDTNYTRAKVDDMSFKINDNAMVAFTPHGQVFAKPVKIRIPFSATIGRAFALLRAADRNSTTWEELDKPIVIFDTLDPMVKVAEVEVTSFSVYTVAERASADDDYSSSNDTNLSDSVPSKTLDRNIYIPPAVGAIALFAGIAVMIAIHKRKSNAQRKERIISCVKSDATMNPVYSNV
jgi:hypothetical protein